MSKQARGSTSLRKQRGGTMFGVIAGLLLGLVVAAAVAVYVTKSPVPFVDRASRGPDPSLPDPGFAPDPNRSLYGRDAPGGLAPSGPITIAPAPVPQVSQRDTPARRDELGDLLASLSKPGANTNTNTNTSPPPAVAPPANAKPPAAAPAGRYVLQVGAFRVLEDAEALKARLAFLGFDVRLQQAQVNGVLVNRVQVGPYARLDDMNRARARLAENKVEATVVRQ
ncbi:SPOR domain-containing protein [Verticiella sediminum]|uniref:SPOR domain-containing protein n=1 Tax=Verticiella sediminum TaxID=1247510 RepID=A0A556AED7_9BURK|nr:SPOR domain-containing protein [Verticiella sediminum]TSH91246.1 SPOR domain-containing protein [Verticiella sediminum]